MSQPAYHCAAALLAAATLCVGVVFATTAVGGSDSYGYVSEAELWLHGSLKTRQPWVTQLPWPDPSWTFAPLGYSPSTHPGEADVITPSFPAGFPLLMAGAKLIGGQEAMFWVVPLAGALLVLATYAIGCRMSSPTAALIAAWLVATSPTVLYMLMTPMSDVPAAAAWAAAVYCMLGTRPRSHACAGLAAAVAILIRPNLAFGAVIFAGWYAVRAARAARDARAAALLRMAAFAVGVLPGILGVALLNQVLNGSPLRSGYGELSEFFAVDHFVPNVRAYAAWLVETQSPIVLAGVAALAVPLRRFWPALTDRSALVAIVGFVLALWVMYGFYLVFGAWWYLRFLLPTWPFVMIGVGAVAVALMQSRGMLVRVVVTCALVAAGVHGIRLAIDYGTFDEWRQHRKVPAMARWVRALTDDNSVILSKQQSGTLRYYAGRLTMRWDLLDNGWLDRAVAWLGDRGLHVYLLVDDEERRTVLERFAGQRLADELERRLVFSYQDEVRMSLFDLSTPAPQPFSVLPVNIIRAPTGLRSVAPVPVAVPATLSAR